MGEMRSAHRILVGKPAERRLVRQLKRKWEDNMKMDLKETG
jgi:hypothetical protein